MTRKERVERNANIYIAHCRGVSLASIARGFEMSERQARRVVQDHKKSQPNILGEPQIEIVAQFLAFYDAAISELAVIASNATSPTLKLKAITTKVNILYKRMQLLQSIGLIPNNPGPPCVPSVNELLSQIRMVFRQHRLPAEAENECWQIFVAWSGREGMFV